MLGTSAWWRCVRERASGLPALPAWHTSFFHSLLVDKKEERGEILHAAACPAGLVEAPSGGNPREVKCPCPWMEGGGEGGVLLLSSDPLLPSFASLLSQLSRGFSASYEGITAPRVFVLMQTDTETTAMAAGGGNSSVRAPWNISRADGGCLLATVMGKGGAGAVPSEGNRGRLTASIQALLPQRAGRGQGRGGCC